MSVDTFLPLAAALRDRLSVIRDQELRVRDPEGQLRQLQAASERITTLQNQLPPGSDPQLMHYLQRCSYDKALAWLDAQLPSGVSPARSDGQ